MVISIAEFGKDNTMDLTEFNINHFQSIWSVTEFD